MLISQTSLYLSTYCSLSVKFSSEIDLQCPSSGFLKYIAIFLLGREVTNGILYFALPNCLFFQENPNVPWSKNCLHMDCTVSITFYVIVKHEIKCHAYKWIWDMNFSLTIYFIAEISVFGSYKSQSGLKINL